MSAIEPDDKDVFQLHSQIKKCADWKIEAVKSANWLSGDIKGEFLSIAGGGWKKGKMVVCLRFIPDEPEPSPIIPTDDLDDLRQGIHNQRPQ